jgi:hypothetical protein
MVYTLCIQDALSSVRCVKSDRVLGVEVAQVEHGLGAEAIG